MSPLQKALDIAEAIGLPIKQTKPYAESDPFQGYDRATIAKLIGKAKMLEALEGEKAERGKEVEEKLKKGEILGQPIIGTRGKVKGRMGIIVKEMPSKFHDGMTWVVVDPKTTEEFFVNPKTAKPYAMSETELEQYNKLCQRSQSVAGLIATRGLEVICIEETSPFHGMVGKVIGRGSPNSPIRRIPVYFEGEPKEVYLPAHYFKPKA